MIIYWKGLESRSQVERLKVLHGPAGSGQLLVNGLAGEGFGGGHGVFITAGDNYLSDGDVINISNLCIASI